MAKTGKAVAIRHQLPAKKKQPSDLIHRIAMDIGKQVVEHIEHAYPQMFDNVSKASASLSIRNSTYNAIIAHGAAFQKGESEQSIKRNEAHRRTMRRLRNPYRQRR